MDQGQMAGNQGMGQGGQGVPVSPFAPVDLPDLNSIPTPGAVPPMVGVNVNIPTGFEAQAMNNGNGQAGAGGQGVSQVSQAAQVAQQQVTGVPTISPATDMTGTGEILPGMEEMAQAMGVASGAMEAGFSMADIPEPKISPENEVPKTSAAGAIDAKKNDAAKATVVGKIENKPKEKAAETKGMDAKIEVGKKPAEKKTGEEVQKKVDAEVAEMVAKAEALDKAKNDTPTVSVPSAGASVMVESLLEECIKHSASDLHLQVGLPPILRVDGVLRPLTTYPVMDNETVQRLVFSTLDEDQQKILIKDKEFDYSFAFGDLGRFRVNAFHEKGNMAAAFRLIPNIIKSVEDLGIPAVVASFAERPNGLVLVTGPTGSGKSTTLAALIDKVNSEKAVHIITIEDPIEFTHQSKRAVVAQREVHYDTYSFAAALRSILREDPDVVLIGEMRDLETIQAAITVAETGHLVFATLHTNSAAQSIDRMIDVFPAHQQPQVRSQLANILVGICSQRLVPAVGGGRVAVAEIMVANPAVRSIIREGKTHQLDMTIQTGVDQGMQTMDRELAKYVKSGVIAYDVAREYTVDPTEFDRLVRG